MKDLRKYATQTRIQLVLGGVLLVFIVGDGLIFIIYGANAAITGLLCIGAGLIPLLLIFLVFGLMDRIINHARKE